MQAQYEVFRYNKDDDLKQTKKKLHIRLRCLYNENNTKVQLQTIVSLFYCEMLSVQTPKPQNLFL